MSKKDLGLSERVEGKLRGIKVMIFRGIMVIATLLLIAINVQAGDGSDSSALPAETIIVVIVVIVVVIGIMYLIAKKKTSKKIPGKPRLINIEMVLKILREEKDWKEDRLEKAKRTLQRVNELREGK